MGLFTDKKVRVLSAENAELKAKLAEATQARIDAKEHELTLEIRFKENNLSHREELSIMRHEFKMERAELAREHEAETTRLQREIDINEENIETEIEDGIIDAKAKLAKKEAELERVYTDKMKKLVADYAEKMARCDKNLEADKISYRKYLRTEHNTEIDGLRKENATLTKENASLQGENTGLHITVGIIEGQLESMTGCVDNVLNALPTISAEFKTPDINVVGMGMNSKPEQKGGEQKKA